MFNEAKLREFLENHDGSPMQVAFLDLDLDEPGYLGGIMIDADTIICMCCGGTIDVEELIQEAVDMKCEKSPIVPFDSWTDLNQEVIGESEDFIQEVAERLNLQ